MSLMESRLLSVEPEAPGYLDGFCVTPQQSLKRGSRGQGHSDET